MFPDSTKYLVRLSFIFINILIDEILVNAADNFHRDKTMNTIKVEINPEANRISVWNNGKGIPVQIHKEHNCYVPEMIFGKHLLIILLTYYP